MTIYHTSIRRIRLWPSLVLLALLCGAHTAQAQAGFSYSADGSEVTHAKTGLTWRRCSEGQVWSGGTCTGTAATYTHEQALVRAKTQTGWRLPNVKELYSLVDKTRLGSTFDPAVFPAAPSGWYWSSTPYVDDASTAWVINSGNTGNVNTSSRSNPYSVRLVR